MKNGIGKEEDIKTKLITAMITSMLELFMLLIQLLFTDRIYKERDYNKVPAALSVPSLYLLFHRRCVLCPLC